MKSNQNNLNWTAVFLVSACALMVVYYYNGARSSNNTDREALEQTIQSHEIRIRKLEELVARLEKQPQTGGIQLAKNPQHTEPIQPPAAKPIAKTEAPGRVVDMPSGGTSSCEFATINAHTQLAASLTWNTTNGGIFVGNLPKGSIVEIVTTTIYTWDDYPNEHALYVKVVEAPAARELEGQSGYIEMRRINHKRCNLGPEFDQ